VTREQYEQVGWEFTTERRPTAGSPAWWRAWRRMPSGVLVNEDGPTLARLLEVMDNEPRNGRPIGGAAA